MAYFKVDPDADGGNNKMYLQELWRYCVDWITSAKDRIQWRTS